MESIKSQHLYTLDAPAKLGEVAKFSIDSSLVTTYNTYNNDEQVLIWQVDTGELIFKGRSIDDFDNKSAFNSNKSSFRVSLDREPDYVYEDYS